MKKIGKLISNSPPWIDLPRDVTANILQRLEPLEILKSAEKVCATWWRVCNEDPSMWRVIDMIDPGRDNLDHLSTLCCRAVNRSQGGLIDISIGSFCTDNLLLYITRRSSRLKRLMITSTKISGKGLKAAVKKWGELEELRLIFTPSITAKVMPSITAKVIETIGKCCPLINTLAFNNSKRRVALVFIDNDRALSIAKNMPNLRHLEFQRILLTEKGMQDILDGCPCLESLDLRRSRIYDLEPGDLQKRCSRIKHLRLLE